MIKKLLLVMTISFLGYSSIFGQEHLKKGIIGEWEGVYMETAGVKLYLDDMDMYLYITFKEDGTMITETDEDYEEVDYEVDGNVIYEPGYKGENDLKIVELTNDSLVLIYEEDGEDVKFYFTKVK